MTITRKNLIDALDGLIYVDDGDKITAHKDGTFTVKYATDLRKSNAQSIIEALKDVGDFEEVNSGTSTSPLGGFVSKLRIKFVEQALRDYHANLDSDADASEDDAQGDEPTVEELQARITELEKALNNATSFATFLESRIEKLGARLFDVEQKIDWR